ncbi:MAG: translation initiation factor IF-2, partial [Acidimicrobiales bacterium]
MPKNPRVYELARELGLSNKETLDLCDALGIGVKSHSSSVQEAQADRVRRKADREGLIRPQQPQEEVEKPKPAKKRAPVKKAVVKKAPAKKAAPPKNSEVLENSAITDSDESPKSDVKLAPASTISPSSSKDDEPANDDLKENFAAKKAAPSRPLPPPPLNMPPPRPLVTSSGQESVKPRPPEDVPVPAVVAVIPNATEVVASPPEEEAAAKASPAEASPEIGTQPVSPPRMPAPPKSVNGKPIPPPPTKPRSVTGKAIPPPPGPPRSRTASKPAGSPAGRGTGAPRGGPARPGSSPSSPARPGAAPGGPGGRPDDRGGPGGRPGGGRGGPQQRRGRKQKRRRRQVEELQPQQAAAYTPVDAPVPEGEVRIERGSTAQEVASRLNRSAADIVKFLLQQGEMVTATQSLTDDNIELFATDLGAEVRLIDPGAEQEQEILRTLDLAFDQDSEEVRPPVITVMGHVDHGKTLLLDRIRSANVIAGEAGGITQHIGAYQVTRNGQSLTFIDTPGHEAFTSMRARGAKATDIVILVVAADDGVMPQTLEAIDHARAAEVPIIVAINKMDREGADQNRVLAQLAERNLIPESYGGDVITVPLSAMTEEGIDDLLDQVVLVAELEELTAGSQGRALGTVLESNLDKGRGPVATVLVQQGTLSVGDPVVAGAAWGRVRAMTDALGNQLKQAGPSTPVEVLGLSEVPRAGDMFTVAPDEKTASKVADTREHWQ